jgi:hypothetical protein
VGASPTFATRVQEVVSSNLTTQASLGLERRFFLARQNKKGVLQMQTSDYLKKTGEELQSYLEFKRRGFKVKPKKGKGSFKRKEKHKEKFDD